MANNPKKGPFDLSINLNQIPSYGSRFIPNTQSGEQINIIHDEEMDIKNASDSKLVDKLKSGQDVRSNPSVILRRNGVRV